MASQVMFEQIMDSPLPWPGYVIYRPVGLDEQPDLAASPIFFPAKDSDELFDALRLKYPHLKSHSERMRDAIIEFLIEERQAEQLQRTTASLTASFDSTTSPDTMPLDAINSSPWQHSWPSMSSTGSSTWSSPETRGLATPTFSEFPLARQTSQVATSTPSASSNGPTPAALEQMTGVFSLSTSSQPKQRVRRKMTEREKVEYRARRIVKACEKCAKRKRKCQHNQPEVEQLTTKSSKSKSRVSPASANVPQAPSTHPQQPLDFDFDMFGVEDSFDMDDSLFNALYDMNDDLVPNAEAGPKKPFDSMPSMTPYINAQSPLRDWQWPQHQDWTASDQVDVNSGEIWINASSGTYQTHAIPGIPNIPQETVFTQPARMAGNYSGNSSSPSKQLSSPAFDSNVVLRTTDYSQDVHSCSDIGTQHDRGRGSSGIAAREGLPPLSIAGPEPSHARRAHTTDRHQIRTDARADSSRMGLDQRPAQATLASAVLRLIGTSKAIRTFARPLASSSVLQSGSLDRVTHVLASSASYQESINIQTIGTAGLYESGGAGASSGLQYQAADQGARSPAQRETSTAVSLRGSSPLQGADPTAHRGRLEGTRSLAQSMDRVDSPSTELYMLKRRYNSLPRSVINAQALHRQANHNPTTDGTQANGGAYLRLLTPDFASSRSLRVKHQRITTDNYTRPTVASAANATSATRAANANPSTTNAVYTSPRPAMVSQSRPLCHMLGKDLHGSDAAYADRLSDHWIYRDHHGRPSSVARNAPHTQSGALVVFALVAATVLAAGNNSSMPLAFVLLAALVQCTTKNSSWLSAMRETASSAHRALRWAGLRKSRESSPGCGSSMQLGAFRLPMLC